MIYNFNCFRFGVNVNVFGFKEVILGYDFGSFVVLVLII